MATTYITDAALQDKVAARFGTTWAALDASAAHWESIIADANQDAYQEIRSRLVARGFTLEQIDDWDRNTEFNRKVATCMALREGGIIRQVDSAQIDKICECIEELDSVPILIDGVEQEVSAGVSRIGFGDLERDDDVFVRDEMVL